MNFGYEPHTRIEELELLICRLLRENAALRARARWTVRPVASLGTGLMSTHAMQRRLGNGLGVSTLRVHE